MALKVVVLGGDETGQELLEAALRVLEPDVLGMEIEQERFDLSLEHRRAINPSREASSGAEFTSSSASARAATHPAAASRRVTRSRRSVGTDTV